MLQAAEGSVQHTHTHTLKNLHLETPWPQGCIFKVLTHNTALGKADKAELKSSLFLSPTHLLSLKIVLHRTTENETAC